MKKMNLELLTDTDILLMVEKWIIEGISRSVLRHFKVVTTISKFPLQIKIHQINHNSIKTIFWAKGDAKQWFPILFSNNKKRWLWKTCNVNDKNLCCTY